MAMAVPVKKLAAPLSLAGLHPGFAHSSAMVSGLADDSRQVEPGDLFFCYKSLSPGQSGEANSAMAYSQAAINAGANAILTDDKDVAAAQWSRSGFAIPVRQSENLGQDCSAIADQLYDQPSRKMDVIGVTGTNGKTTVCFAAAWLLNRLGQPAGQIGTLGAGVSKTGGINELLDTGMTTPPPLAVQKLLRYCLDRDAKAAVMEVSSHALTQSRVAAVHFKTAVFTNLTQDHLDYHGSMSAYQAAKFRLFNMPGLCHAIVNADDPTAEQLLAQTAHLNTYRYSLRAESADLYFDEISPNPSAPGYSVRFAGRWGRVSTSVSVVGDYNLSNLLAVSLVALIQGFSLQQVAAELAHFPGVPGRMKSIKAGDGKPHVVIDYAHTPDAVERALVAIRHSHFLNGQLIAVLGCGGNRDKAKRPLMAQAAANAADICIFTSDNPRFESAESIVEDMIQGFDEPSGTDNQSRLWVELDRAKAIAHAIRGAQPQDCILVLGKGHENYQEINGIRRPLSDEQISIEALTAYEGETCSGGRYV